MGTDNFFIRDASLDRICDSAKYNNMIKLNPIKCLINQTSFHKSNTKSTVFFIRELNFAVHPPFAMQDVGSPLAVGLR